MKRFFRALFLTILWLRVAGLLVGLAGLLWQGATYGQVISGSVGSLKEFAGVVIGGFVYENIAAYVYLFSGAAFVPAVFVWLVLTLQKLKTAGVEPVFGPVQASALLLLPTALDYVFDTVFFQFFSLVGFLFLLYEVYNRTHVLATQTLAAQSQKPKTYFGWRRPTRPQLWHLIVLVSSFCGMIATGLVYANQAQLATYEGSTVSQAQGAVYWAVTSDVFELVFVIVFILFSTAGQAVSRAKQA